ncbi:MAG: DUF6760 family protein [Actinomycetota bacterium]
MTCSGDELYREMAYLAFHCHWSLDDLLDLEHGVRRRFIGEIGRLDAAGTKR